MFSLFFPTRDAKIEELRDRLRQAESTVLLQRIYITDLQYALARMIKPGDADARDKSIALAKRVLEDTHG